MGADEIRALLQRNPFEPFRFHLTSGTTFDVRDPNCVALGARRVFIAVADADRQAFFSYQQIAAIETLDNGRNGKSPRRRRRPPS